MISWLIFQSCQVFGKEFKPIFTSQYYSLQRRVDEKTVKCYGENLLGAIVSFTPNILQYSGVKITELIGSVDSTERETLWSGEQANQPT